MPETLDDLLMSQPPTAERPLLGTVVLVVEDSRHACEALRLICQRSGARIRRAESLASAKRHLCAYRPRVVVIDMGLPDGSGGELIAQLAQSEPRIDAIIATSGDVDQKKAALEAGADVFLEKPLASVSAFQTVVLSLLPEDLRPKHRLVPKTDNVVPDPIALRDDLALAVDLLSTKSDRPTRDYVAAFLSSLGTDAGDSELVRLAGDLRGLTSGSPAQLTKQITDRIAVLAPV
ncbi:MAG: response regulator [Silicimonas sp.]|nr:response regulator [Silicimonas sp.]